MANDPQAPQGVPARRPFDLSGGWLCLDFANTTRHKPPEREDIPAYADLVAWSVEAGAVTREHAAALVRESVAHPRRAQAVLERAHALRTPLYKVFAAIAAAKRPSASDLDAINAAIAEAAQHYRVVQADHGFHWDVDTSAEAPDLALPIWPVARSAADLLTSEDLAAVRECAADPCAWLFIDKSRNHGRRWCDMKICGNRAKARRHYQRKTGQGG